MDFQQAKLKSSSQVDRSKKGSIDAPIADLVDTINSLPVYFTTSCCSGRTAVFWQDDQDGAVGRQKDGQWLYTTHESVVADQLVEALCRAPQRGEATLKFEPVVLHVQCLSLQNAQDLLAVALQSGLRNSGIVLGRKQRIMLAIRSTHGLEVPLIANGKLLVSVEYVRHLVTVANVKMVENGKRTARLAAGIDNLSQKYTEQQQEQQQCASGRRPRKKEHSKRRNREFEERRTLDEAIGNDDSNSEHHHMSASEPGSSDVASCDKNLLSQSNDRDSDDDMIGLVHIDHTDV